jgi:membrane protein implicated in regulation of membrane protease activity
LGAVLFLWTSAEFFMLAFLTSRFLEGAGIWIWLQGYLLALLKSPAALAGILLLAVAILLTVRPYPARQENKKSCS